MSRHNCKKIQDFFTFLFNTLYDGALPFKKYFLLEENIKLVYTKFNNPKNKYGDKMKIQESAENYLETILILQNRNGEVRSIDIANELDYSKPSVSVAMKHLRENGFIETDVNGFITLLEPGREIAERIYERHTFLSTWLTSLGVDKSVAAEDACRIEHVISAESFEAIKKSAGK